jgi:hypothetical protein
LVVSGIVINSVSVAIAAVTSLDWKKQATHNREFAKQLSEIVHVHDGEEVLVLKEK